MCNIYVDPMELTGYVHIGARPPIMRISFLEAPGIRRASINQYLESLGTPRALLFWKPQASLGTLRILRDSKKGLS